MGTEATAKQINLKNAMIVYEFKLNFTKKLVVLYSMLLKIIKMEIPNTNYFMNEMLIK